MNPAIGKGRAALLWALRIALSAIFLYAGVAKMHGTLAFAESIASFRLLSEELIAPAALTLPSLEILAAALALADGRMRRAGTFCLLVLLVVFTVALASAIVRGLHVDCGCFGGDRFDVLSPTRNLWIALARDLVLAVLALFLYADARRDPKTKAPATGDIAGAGG